MMRKALETAKLLKLKYLDGFRVREITSPEDPALKGALHVYERNFPVREEREQPEALAGYIADGLSEDLEGYRYHFTVAEKRSLASRVRRLFGYSEKDEPKPVGMISCDYLGDGTGFWHYVASEERRKGIGTLLFRDMIERLKRDAQKEGKKLGQVFVEVEKEEAENTSMDPIERLQFHGALGGKIIYAMGKRVPYIQRPADEKRGTVAIPLLPVVYAVNPDSIKTVGDYKNMVGRVMMDAQEGDVSLDSNLGKYGPWLELQNLLGSKGLTDSTNLELRPIGKVLQKPMTR